MGLLLFNVDNTLVKTKEEIIKHVMGYSDHIYPPPLPANFFERHPEILLSAAAFDGAAKVLQQLARNGSAIVYVADRSPWFESLTTHWLRMNGFPGGLVLCSSNKREMVRRFKPAAFVGDAPHEIDSVKDLVDTICVPAKPYNLRYPNRFETWDEFPLAERTTLLV